MSASLLVWRNKMKKTFQKWISALLCAALVAAGSVCAFADTENAKDTAALADGSYTVGAATDTTGATAYGSGCSKLHGFGLHPGA